MGPLFELLDGIGGKHRAKELSESQKVDTTICKLSSPLINEEYLPPVGDLSEYLDRDT